MSNLAPYYEHLQELKKRLIWCLAITSLVAIFCFTYHQYIYHLLLQPLSNAAGGKLQKIIYTNLPEAFFTYLKLAIFSSINICFPYYCYHCFKFIKPALTSSELTPVTSIFIGAPILFYFGVGLMFYLVIPNAWLFFLNFQQVEAGYLLKLELKISEYLDLVIQLAIAFGLAFQLPIAMMILAIMGLVDAQSLKKWRKFAIVLSFIVAAIFTPPDIISQIALALPLVLLYEFSIVLCKIFSRRK